MRAHRPTGSPRPPDHRVGRIASLLRGLEEAPPDLDPTHPFPMLAHVLGSEAACVEVLAAFHHAAPLDVIAFEHAAAMGDWRGVRRLALRLAWSCLFIEEPGVAGIFVPLAFADEPRDVQRAFTTSYAGRMPEVLCLLERVEAWLVRRHA